MSGLLRSESSSSFDSESLNGGSVDDFACNSRTGRRANSRLNQDNGADGARSSTTNSSMSPDVQISAAVASIMKELKLVPGVHQITNPEHWFHKMCLLMACMIKSRPQGIDSALQERLKRHIRCLENGELSVTLVGASYLQLHPDIHMVRCEQTDSFPEHLPSPIRQMLYQGKFVPMRHILYAEALKLEFVSHMKGKKKVEADPYPLNLKVDTPPSKFLQEISRPDIIRALTSHALTLSARFPRLAANMHNLVRHMWILMYQEEIHVSAALDLYDVYFQEFERQLNSLAFLNMNKFPTHMIKNVLKNR